MKSGTLSAILLGGIVAATVDIGAACLINHRPATFILHTIAGGLVAKSAYSGGAQTALLGLFLQEVMGIIIAAVYVIAAHRMKSLRTRWLSRGLVYGAVIFVVMNYVVLPLSAWHVVPHFTAVKFTANLIAMLLFGLIVAYFASRSRT